MHVHHMLWNRDLQLATGAAAASDDSLIRRFGAFIDLQFGILLFEIFHFKISCLPPRGYFVSLGLARRIRSLML
jgi:hypothetical protein